MARNLVIVRAGDASLHGGWLSGGPRDWDLHISYFAKGEGPVSREGEGVTWTHDPAPSKWQGIAMALEKAPLRLDAYDYIALPDDDVLTQAPVLNRAFALAREEDLALCQISLHHDSYFGDPMTLARPRLKLHYSTRVELMAPIFRIDLLKRLLPYFPLPGNLWAMDHIAAKLASGAPDAIAVLDEVSVLHTRSFWTSEMYAADRARTGADALEVEARLLAEQGFEHVPIRVLGGKDRRGRRVGAREAQAEASLIGARVLRKFRSLQPNLQRIASARDGRIAVMRRMRGAEHLPVDFHAAKGRPKRGGTPSGTVRT